MKEVNVREIAYEGLLLYEKENAKSHLLFGAVLERYAYLDEQQRGFLKRLLEGYIERLITLDYVINSFSKTPVRKMKVPIRVLMRMSVYQLLYMDALPDYSVCDEAVKLAKRHGFSSLSGFVNGVLRNISRNKDSITYPDATTNKSEYLSVVYSCPEYIVDLFLKEWGEELTVVMLRASLESPKMCVRVNERSHGVEEIPAVISDHCIRTPLPNAYYVPQQCAGEVLASEAFAKGLFTIQDMSSQLVCTVAGIREGMHVLDVCASPGGKSMHAWDLCGEKGTVISCDVSEDKLIRIRENFERCRLSCDHIVCADATEYHEEFRDWADVVLCDVPCSGLGVLARKNDIKYNITSEGLDSLLNLQKAIVDNVVAYVKKGGILMYSTCTVRKGENHEMMDYICKTYDFAPVSVWEELPDTMRISSAKNGYVQLFSGNEWGTDGFFFAKLRRLS